jgi:uncharacterized protein with von Willebrand factor type A (vWA) domain
VVLLDVSGSMTGYSHALLEFAFGLGRGMRAALPYLDDLVAGDTFDSLALLARGLGGDR